MKKIYRLLLLVLTLTNFLYKINEPSNDETIYQIKEEVEGNVNYKKAEFQYMKKETIKYFKYVNSSLPSSKISSIRFYFDQ